MDQVFEGTPKAEIRLEGRRVTRGDVSNDWGTRLQWKVSLNGKVVATVPARVTRVYEHPEPAPGKYEIVLELWKHDGYKAGVLGKYIEVSNTVTYTI